MSKRPAQIVQSSAKDEATAIRQIKSQASIEKIGGLLFFCSSRYNLSILAAELQKNFACPIAGCTSAGEMAAGYQSDGIVALVFCSDSFVLHPKLIKNIQSFNFDDAMMVANDIERQLEHSAHFAEDKMFGFLLSDGLSLKEENLIARLSQAFDQISLFGGSAGDDSNFKETFVYCEGLFYPNAAVLTIIEVKDDFQLFKTQHFEASDKELITTAVDFANRVVSEIDGEPAAIAYARINQLDPDNLTPQDFANYPLMIQLSDEWYIRSIANQLADNSLVFYSAIDEGLPLSIGEAQDMLDQLEKTACKIKKQFKDIYFTLGCDCILRKVENTDKGRLRDFDKVLKSLNFVGFSSYGEQYNGIHINQTLVAVVVGKRRDV